MTTRPPRRPGSRARRFLAAGTIIVAGGFLPAEAPAIALTVAPPENDTAAIDVLVEGGSIVQPGETVTIRVSIRALESRPLARQAIRLQITEEPLESESQLRRFLNRDADVPLRVIDVRLSPEVLQLETSDVRIDIVVPDLSLASDIEQGADDVLTPQFSPAIYGLQADFLDSFDNPEGDALLTQRQTLVVFPNDVTVKPAAIAPIVPVILPATGGRTLTAQELDSYTSPGGVLDAALGIIRKYPSTVAVDSRITLSIDALGDQAPPDAVSWQEAIDSLEPSVISLPWADADPLATIAIDTLLYGRAGQYPWLHGGVTSEKLEDLATRSADAILVPSSVITSDRTVVQLRTARMVRVDDMMSAFVQRAALAASADEAEAALQRAQGLIARRALSGSGEVLVFHTGRLPVTASVVRLGDILDRLWAMEVSTVTEVPLTVPASEIVIAINETPATTQWTAFTTQVRELWETDVRYVSIADNPEEAILGRWNRYQALLSSAWIDNSAGLEAEWLRAEADSAQFRSSVRIEEGSTFTVLSDRTELPITVRNDLRSTVRLQLAVQPQRAIVGVETALIDVVIDAESVQSLRIPITALASGTAPILLTLQSISGEPIGEPIELVVTIRAGWENVITGVLAALIGIVFAVGIYRAIQRRRQPQEDSPAPSDTDVTP